MSRLATVFAALIFLAPALAPHALSADKTIVRVGEMPVQDWLPLWVMKEKGIAEKVGIDLRGIKVTGGTELNALIAADQADVIYSANVLILLMATQGLIPEKFTVLDFPFDYTDIKHPLSGLIVSDKIKSWKDLEGKTVATHFRRSLFALAFKERLRLEKVNIDKVNIVEVPLPQQEIALRAGRVDAITPGSDFAARALANKTGRLMSWYAGEPPFDDYMVSIVVMRPKFYKENPDAVEKYIRAHLMALQWIENNPAEAKQIAARQLGIKEPEAIARFPLLRFTAKGVVSESSLRLSQKMLIEEGLLKSQIDFKALFTGTDLITRIRQELGIR